MRPSFLFCYKAYNIKISFAIAYFYIENMFSSCYALLKFDDD